jgi:hypothetical protein
MGPSSVVVQCLQCGQKRCRLTAAQARNLPSYDEKPLIFCSMDCNRAFVQKQGKIQQSAVLADQEQFE